MKRILFCCVFMLMFGNVYATTLSVCGFDSLDCDTPQKDTNFADNITNWYLTCDAYSMTGEIHENMKLVGESLCVSESVLDGADANTKAITTIGYDSTSRYNSLCVCRITSPFVSSWFSPLLVGVGAFSGAEDCNLYCSQYCARAARLENSRLINLQISD